MVAGPAGGPTAAELGKSSGLALHTPFSGSPVLGPLPFSALPRDSTHYQNLVWMDARQAHIHAIKFPLPRGALISPRLTGCRHLDKAGVCYLPAMSL